MRYYRSTFWFYLMAGPAIIGFLAFALIPMLYSLYLSFTRYTVVNPPEWIGIGHYVYLFRHDPSFWPSVQVTLMFAALQVPLALATSLSLALLLNCPMRFRGLFRTIYYVPSILPSAASAAIFVFIFNPEYGMLNALLARAGIEGPAWLDDSAWGPADAHPDQSVGVRQRHADLPRRAAGGPPARSTRRPPSTGPGPGGASSTSPCRRSPPSSSSTW